MNVEELLKSISELIKKNEQFFVDNPEAFVIVEDRLHKAIDYEDYQPEEDDEEDFYNDSYDEAGISDLFDNVPEEDIDEDMDGELSNDEAAQWLKENNADIDAEHTVDADGDGDVEIAPEAQAEIKANDEPKISSSGYRDWVAKDKYEDHHQSAIEQFMSEGWSHREAERMANAHEGPTDFMSALKHKIKPTQPSEKMLSHMKGLAGDWLRNAERKIGESADARKNPIKHASSKALTAHEDAHGDFKRAYDDFMQSDDLKDLRGRERHKAIRAFKEKWRTDNPTYRETVIASANSGKAFKEADEARAQHLLEGHEAVQDAGKIGGMGSAGEFSSAASGGTEGMTSQGAAQMVGGAKDEGGFSAGTVKDPAMVFSEKNQEYLDSEQRKKSIDRLKSRLNPDQAKRFSALQGFNKGNK